MGKKILKKSQKTKTISPQKKIGINPLGDRVLVRPFTEEDLRRAGTEKSTIGIILPESITKEKSAQGEVFAVGPGKWESGKLIPIGVKPGDRVVFSKYGYDEVEYKDEEYYLIKEENILAIIK